MIVMIDFVLFGCCMYGFVMRLIIGCYSGWFGCGLVFIYACDIIGVYCSFFRVGLLVLELCVNRLFLLALSGFIVGCFGVKYVDLLQ